MIFTILLLVLLFIYFDCYILKEQNSSIFKDIFYLPNWVLPLYLVLILALVYQTRNWEYMPSFLFVSLFPVYLIKRFRFKKLLRLDPHPIDIRLSLVSDTMGVVLVGSLWMIAIAIVMKIFTLILPGLESRLGILLSLTATSYYVMLILIYRMIKRYPQLNFFDVLGLKSYQHALRKILGYPILIGILMAGLTSLVLYTRAYHPPTPLSDMIETTTSSFVLLAFLGIAILLAPFFEEIIFRGYFFYVANQFKGQLFAFLLISILFGLLHFDQYWGDWSAIGIVTFLGFVLTYLRVWTGTSIASIVAHYTYNGTMTIMPIIILLLSNPPYFMYQMQYANLDSSTKEEFLLASIKLHPDHAESYNDLAWLYTEENKNLEEALRLIDQALTFQPENFAFWDTKAEVLYKMGRIKEAIEIEEDIVSKDPTNLYAKEQLEKFYLSSPEMKD